MEGDQHRMRLLVADDHPEILEEIRNLLTVDFDVIGTACDGMSLLKAAEDLRPDIVVTDIGMPSLSGIQASRKILDSHLCKAVVALTIYKDPQLVRTAFDAGITGYVLKESAGDELIQAIRFALQGRRFVSPAIRSGRGN